MNKFYRSLGKTRLELVALPGHDPGSSA